MNSKIRSGKVVHKKAIHFVGYPCKVDKKKGSFWLSSSTNPHKVTCKGCRRACGYILQHWK